MDAVASIRSHVTAVYNRVVGVVTEIKVYVSKKVAEAKVATKKIASNIYSRITSSSKVKNTVSGAIDKSAEYGANRGVKKAITEWTTYDWAISRSITKPTTLAGSFISHSAQYTGTAIFTSVDAIGDIYRGEYFGLTVDVTGALAGLRLGSALGTVIEGGLIAVGVSASATVVPVFIASVILGVGIDKLGNIIKQNYYGGK